MASAYPSRRGSAPAMSAPDSGSRAIPCPPPTTQDQSSMVLIWCPRRPSSARVASETRDQAVAIGADTWCRDRLLEVEPELQEVEQHLRLGLQDAVGAGRADAEHEGAVLED